MGIRYNFPTKAENPFAYGYEPELGDAPVLEPNINPRLQF